MVRFCRMQPPLRHGYDMKKVVGFQKHVLRPYDNHALKSVVSVS